jgi:aromatic ring-cleaving dioxygenase
MQKVLAKIFENQPLTIVEQGSVQVAVHGTGRKPHRPKVYDHQLAPCNFAFSKNQCTDQIPWLLDALLGLTIAIKQQNEQKKSIKYFL